MNDYIILVSVGLFAVYEQRHKGWSYFWGALSGKYAIPPKPTTTTTTNTTSTSNTTTGSS